MINKCNECKYYNDDYSYKGTGYCKLHSDYVDNDEICENFEEE